MKIESSYQTTQQCIEQRSKTSYLTATLRKRAGYVKYYRQSWYSQLRTWAARLNQPVAFRLCRVDARYEWDVWFVVSVNILRRQLDPSQLTCVAVELEPMFAAEAKERYAETVGSPSKQSEVNLPRINRAPQARERRRQEAHERKDVLQRLSDLFVCEGVPDHIRSDNGSEFRAKCVREWLSRVGVKTLFIKPGSPWENGTIESFFCIAPRRSAGTGSV